MYMCEICVLFLFSSVNARVCVTFYDSSEISAMSIHENEKKNVDNYKLCAACWILCGIKLQHHMCQFFFLRTLLSLLWIFSKVCLLMHFVWMFLLFFSLPLQEEKKYTAQFPMLLCSFCSLLNMGLAMDLDTQLNRKNKENNCKLHLKCAIRQLVLTISQTHTLYSIHINGIFIF